MIDSNMLSGIKNAENSLREVEQEERRKDMGVLADLPEGHPMLQVFEEAKKKYEERIAEEQKGEESKGKRKAKKNVKKSKRQKDVEEEENLRKKKVCMKNINKKIDDVHNVANELLSEVKIAKDVFKNHPMSATRMVRLERLIAALSRGLSDSKMTTTSFEDEQHGR